MTCVDLVDTIKIKYMDGTKRVIKLTQYTTDKFERFRDYEMAWTVSQFIDTSDARLVFDHTDTAEKCASRVTEIVTSEKLPLTGERYRDVLLTDRIKHVILMEYYAWAQTLDWWYPHKMDKLLDQIEKEFPKEHYGMKIASIKAKKLRRERLIEEEATRQRLEKEAEKKHQQWKAEEEENKRLEEIRKNYIIELKGRLDILIPHFESLTANSPEFLKVESEIIKISSLKDKLEKGDDTLKKDINAVLHGKGISFEALKSYLNL